MAKDQVPVQNTQQPQQPQQGQQKPQQPVKKQPGKDTPKTGNTTPKSGKSTPKTKKPKKDKSKMLNPKHPQELAYLKESGIRGEGAYHQTDRLSLGRQARIRAPPTTKVVEVPKYVDVPVQRKQTRVVDRPIEKVVEKVIDQEVMVDYVSDQERNMMAEAFAKVALLTMENNRLKMVWDQKQRELQARGIKI